MATPSHSTGTRVLPASAAIVAALICAPLAAAQASTVTVVPETSDTSGSGTTGSSAADGGATGTIVRPAEDSSATGSVAVGASTTTVVLGPSTSAHAASRAAPNAALRTGSPFVLSVEQVVPLAPPEWDVLELRQLESRLVNAPDDAARGAIAAELALLRERLEHDRAVVLMGRMRGGAGTPAAVLVPAGYGGSAVTPDGSVRVIPLDVSFPAGALGDATRAFPVLRTFGTAASPGFVAASIEPAGGAPAPGTSAASATPSPWARRTATSLAESSNLVVDGALEPGPAVNGRVPLAVMVRNAGSQALPPCEVFFEFMDASGNLIHREFRWVTRQRSEALEATLPALAPGDRTVIETPVPPAIAAQARSARVLIVKLLPRTPGSRR